MIGFDRAFYIHGRTKLLPRIVFISLEGTKFRANNFINLAIYSATLTIFKFQSVIVTLRFVDLILLKL